jgi:hypothetical protein
VHLARLQGSMALCQCRRTEPESEASALRVSWMVLTQAPPRYADNATYCDRVGWGQLDFCPYNDPRLRQVRCLLPKTSSRSGLQNRSADPHDRVLANRGGDRDRKRTAEPRKMAQESQPEPVSPIKFNSPTEAKGMCVEADRGESSGVCDMSIGAAPGTLLSRSCPMSSRASRVRLSEVRDMGSKCVRSAHRVTYNRARTGITADPDPRHQLRGRSTGNGRWCPAHPAWTLRAERE